MVCNNNKKKRNKEKKIDREVCAKQERERELKTCKHCHKSILHHVKGKKVKFNNLHKHCSLSLK